jgi:Helicase associated domain
VSCVRAGDASLVLSHPCISQLHVSYIRDRKRAALYSWYQRLRELWEYKKEHGHCLVPQRYPRQQKMATWVNKVRMARQSLTPTQLQALEAVGFVWAQHEGLTAWQERYAQLQAYQAVHGDCNVPAKDAVSIEEDRLSQLWPFHTHVGSPHLKMLQENSTLGRWVSTQRAMYKALKNGRETDMNEEKIALLEAIGFQWGLRKQQGGDCPRRISNDTDMDSEVTPRKSPRLAKIGRRTRAPSPQHGETPSPLDPVPTDRDTFNWRAKASLPSLVGYGKDLSVAAATASLGPSLESADGASTPRQRRKRQHCVNEVTSRKSPRVTNDSRIMELVI